MGPSDSTPWRRNYLAVWVSLFSTSMGLMAFLPVLTVYVGERYSIHDPELTWWGGIIYGAAPLAAAICGPLWGALGDRVGKRPMAIRANLAIALTTAFMPLAPSPLWLLFLRAVQGAFAGYVAPAIALVAQDAPPERQGRTIGQLQAAMALGSMLGPVLGSEVTLLWGRAALFWITSVQTALAAFVLWRFAHEVRTAPAAPAPSFGRDFVAATGELLRSPVFAVLLLLILALRLGQNMMEPFVAMFVRQLGAPQWMLPWCENADHAIERTIAIAFAILAVAQVLFTPLWGRASDRYGPLRCLAALALGLGGVLAATAAVQTIDQFLGARGVAAILMAGSMTLAYAAAGRRVSPARRTLAFSLVQSCMQLGFAGGPLMSHAIGRIGAIDEHPNLRLPFAVAGGLCIASAFGMVLLRLVSKGSIDRAAVPVSADPS